ncbi:MAG: hypothetical protein FWE36_07945 [Erysipelotrichales bacterium]|nr:hypothetical protein [Erysipelotrichales bacterium]
MKKNIFSVAIFALFSLLLTACALLSDNSSNNNSEIKTEQEVLNLVNTRPEDTRQLITRGFDVNGNITMLHELGRVNTFIGWASMGRHYDGLAPDSITVEESRAHSSAATIESQRSYNFSSSVTISASVGKPGIFEISTSLTLGRAIGWSQRHATTVTEALTIGERHQWSLTPERGSGYFAVGMTSVIAFYQESLINPQSGNILNAVISTGVPQDAIPVLRLIRGNSSTMLSDITRAIDNSSQFPSAITNFTATELNAARTWARNNNIFNGELSVVHGSRVDSVRIPTFGQWSNNWSNYVELDTLMSPSNNTILNQMLRYQDTSGYVHNVFMMRNAALIGFGFRSAELSLNYTSTGNNNDDVRIQFRIRNATTGTIVYESRELSVNGIWHATINLSQLNDQHTFIIEVRARKLRAVADVQFNADRIYHFIFR